MINTAAIVSRVMTRVAASAVLDQQAMGLVLFVRLDAGGDHRRMQHIGEGLHTLGILEERTVVGAPLEQRHDDRPRRPAPLDDLQILLERDQLLEPRFQFRAGDLRAIGTGVSDIRCQSGTASSESIEASLLGTTSW